MKNSLKQLLRTPMKALLFFLLLTAGTALLAVGACLFARTAERIAAVESEFTTIATVEQKPVSTYVEEGYNSCLGAHGNEFPVYDKLIPFDVLKDAELPYIGEPESRSVYLSSWMDPSPRTWNIIHQEFVAAFTPLETGDGKEPVKVEVTRVFYSNVIYQQVFLPPPDNLKVGDVISVCQHFSGNPAKLEKGKTYLASMVWRTCSSHSEGSPEGEFVIYQRPHSTQYDIDGKLLPGNGVFAVPGLYAETEKTVVHATAEQSFPAFDDPSIGVEEISADSDDPADQILRGDQWLSWTQNIRMQYGLSPVIPTNDLSLLPSFHNGKAKIVQGRAITEEEYESGEKVCLVSDAFLNDLYYYYIGIGTEISLPLLCSLYNYDGGKQVESTGNYRTSPFLRRYSLLNADGAPYSPFANDKYTVVGFYSIDPKEQEAGRTELMVDTVIIPAKSVTASDENNIAYYAPMNAKSTSFRIPNGTIEEFDRKLHEAVPEAAGLTITYYDNGYTEVMGDLNRAKSTAALLLFAGLGSTLAIVTLLLYFFVVREKKRTAIERSLGMTKGQCAVSLLSGLLVLALLAVCLGAALGGISVEHMGNGEAVESEFNLMFSDWQDVSAEAGETGAVSLWLRLAAPFAVWLAVLVLGLFLLGRNLKIEPIYLLSGKLEDS